MSSCLLCLQIITEGDNYIPARSPQWIEFNIQNIIEKHLWPIENSETIFGVCNTCWYQLYDFHIFYTKIKDAQERNIEIDIDEPKLNKLENELYPNDFLCIPKIEIKSNDEMCFTKNDIIENFVVNEPLLTVMSVDQCETSPIIYTQPKGKQTNSKGRRGRPRKKEKKLIVKPKRKRGRPRKYDINKPKTPPLIKRRVGRPCKIRVTDNLNILNACEEAVISEPEVITNDLPVRLNDKDVSEINDLKLKKPNIFSNLRRRKRSQQHKSLMRNYIATSVRCMEFLRK